MKATGLVALLVVCFAHHASADDDALPLSCSDVLAQGFTESGDYEIDPGAGPMKVYCDLSPGKAYTVLHHDRESEDRESRRVDNCEEPGSFVAQITYTSGLKKAIALADVSDYCEQFIGYTAHASVLQYKGQQYGGWTNRDGKPMSNWGGAPTGTTGCGCSVHSKGCLENKQCNADCNIHQETEDSGFLKDKDHLPITSVYFGDTGTADDDEYGYYELGPLRCTGGPTKMEPEIPVFETNTDYVYRYKLPKLEPGECRVEFEAAACNDVFIGFSEEEGEQSNLIELNIGGWGNSKTVWRPCKQCEPGAVWEEKGVISCNEKRGFWIDWCFGYFRLGRQGAALQSLSWSPPQMKNWGYVAFSTGYGSGGSFEFGSFYARVRDSCEHEMANLNCGHRYINIIEARFGRSNKGVCVHEHMKSTQCASAKSMSVVGKLCHGKHTCRMTVSVGVFGNPCVGTHKYLHVKYQCLDEPKPKFFTPDACVESKCNPQGGECVPVRENEYRCSCRTGFTGKYCENEYAMCKAWGDPHYTQFNGRNFNYQGKCKYILAEPCVKGEKYFKVVGVNVEAPWNNKVSFNRQLEVQIDKTEIFLLQNKQVLIDNNINNVPCSTGADITIDNDGRFLVVTSASYGLKVMWDGNEVYKILVDKTMYGENMCGLCGSIKPYTDGIFIMRNGEETTDINKFGDSWTANPLTCPGCKDCFDLNHCMENPDLKARVLESCGVIKDPTGVFSVGLERFDAERMYESCVFDMCSREDFDNKIRCNNLEEYANRILLENKAEYLQDEDAIIHWRDKLNCPFKCPQGSMYSICTTSCQRTCYQPMVPAICQMSCVEGCEVSSGFVMENGIPVPESKCGCRYDNKYYNIGEKWINHDCSESCFCDVGGQATCHPVSCVERASCGSRNQIHGCHCDPNYIGDGCSRCQKPCPSKMGNEDKIRANVDEGNQAVIDISRPIECEGYIKYFTIKRHTDSMEPVMLIVWRRLSNEGNKFTIVGSAYLTIDDDSLDLCSCDNSKIPVRRGDYIGFVSARGTVYYDDETDPAAGKVYTAPFFDSVEPMTEVEFSPLEGLRAYSINVVLESYDGKHVEPFMFSSYLGMQSGQIPNEAISASSARENYAAHRGRLDNTEYGACSWTAETADHDQWLQVDLGQETVVIGVVSQGHCGIVDHNGSPRGCVKLFHVQYSSDGQNFEYVTDEHGEIDTFKSRCKCQKHVKNFFHDALFTRFIRFRPVAWKRAISMRVEIIGRDVEVDEPTVDETAPSGKLLDDLNTAVVLTGKPFKRNGNLKGVKYHPLSKDSFTVAVLRATSSANTFILIGRMYVTSSGVGSLQVHKVREESEQIPVRKGDVLCLLFEKAGIGYDDDVGSSSAVMTATLRPTDFNSIALNGKITFTNSASRVYRGFRPIFEVATTTTIAPVMATGCLGIGEGQVKDEQLTASSFCDSFSKPVRARLNLKDQQGLTGGWCGKELDQTAYVQADFLTPRRCAGVVTQGFSNKDRKWFVQKYVVKCSLDLKIWDDIVDNDGNPVMFSGNSDQETEVQNYFTAVMNCRAIRIIPMFWTGLFPALRFDVMGLPDVISVVPEIGFSLIKRLSTGSGGYTFVMPGQKFEEDGFVTGVRFLAVRRGSFKLMVFRPEDVAARKYKVVGRRNIRVKKADVVVEVKFRQKKKKRRHRKWLSVKKGDMVGLSFTKSVLYKSKEGDDLTTLVYSPNSKINNYRKLRAGRAVTFADEAKRSYSILVLFQAKSTDEVVSSVDAQDPLGLENGQFPDEGISVSSTYISDDPLQNFGPGSSRLKYNGEHDGAWVPADDDVEPWIQVDTGTESVFTGVITQGRHSLLNWWTVKYRVVYSSDGDNWKDILGCDKNQAVFDGNSDSDTEVTHYFCQAANGRYLRIYLLEWNDRPALRFEVLGGFKTAATEYGPSCINREFIDSENYILLAAGNRFESDGHVTEWKYFSKNKRPFKAGVWRPDPNDPLRYKHIGSSDIPGQTINELATYRLDKDNYIPFRKGDVMGWSFTEPVICFDEGDESIELLYSGNGGKLSPTPVGQYRKFKSSGKQAYSISCSVSVSQGGSVPAVACTSGLGMEDNRIPDVNLDSSSVLSQAYSQVRARLNTEATATMMGCWAPALNEDQYIRVDLGKPTLVTGLSIQGCNGEERWVTKFRVQLSKDATNWLDAKDTQGKNIFYGNTDSDSIVLIFFKEEYKAQFVSIIPEDWNSGIGLRFEVHGCPTECQKEWGAEPLPRQWHSTQCDKTFVVNTENPLVCNSYIKGWRMILKNRAPVIFYVLRPIDVGKGLFKVVGKTRVPRSRDRPVREVYEIILDRQDWIEVRSGYMIGFASRKRSPIFRDKWAQDKAEHLIARNRKKLRRLDVGDELEMKRFKEATATYSFKAILTQEGVGDSKDTLPPISCSGGLGMENGAIPDDSITVSSALDVLKQGVGQSRLMGSSAWAAGIEDKEPFIQVDFGYTAKLTGVATQGDPNNENWVTSYTVEYTASFNFLTKEPENFEFVKFTNALSDIFSGNVDQNTVKINNLKEDIEARTVRVTVKDFHNYPSMRLEFLGCSESDPCDPNPCQNDALCRKSDASLGYSCNCPMEYGGKNCQIRTRRCCAHGDPHYCNFDGQKFNFQGDCEYILTRTLIDSQMDHFEITADNVQSERRSSVSVTREVFVRIGDKTFDFKRNREVFVNQERISCPYERDGVSVTDGSNGRVNLKTEFGLVVSWDGRSKVDIHLTEDYKNQVEGLCGNFNGEEGDDFIVMASGEQTTDMSRFGESWSVDPTCAGCVDCREEDVCHQTGLIVEAQKACSVLTKEHGPFSMCALKINPQPYYKNCMFDFCALYPTQGSLCEDIQSYADKCADVNIQVNNWRQPGFCGVNCPQGMVLNMIGTLCPNTCGDQDAALDCTGKTGPMCECMSGLFLEDGNRCVPDAECGCTYQGLYRKNNGQFMADDCSEICTCDEDHSPDCHEVSCHDRAQCMVQNGVRGCYCVEGWSGDGIGDCEEILEPQELIVCENEMLSIDCSGSNELIEILEVDYSTQPRDKCAKTADNIELDSHSYGQTIVRNRCHKQSTCSFSVGSPVFGSFADGVYKALYVKYQCRESVTVGICHPDVVLIGCPDESLEINCGNLKVDVIDVHFGRPQGDQTCSGQESELTMEECFVGSALHRMVEACHTQHMCTVHVVPESFGNDPCPDTRKFLRILYRCVPNPDPRVIEDDKCDPDPCKHGTCKASSVEPKYVCQCSTGYTGQHCDIGKATCTALGDPHYITFDKKEYSFMGSCKYTLVKNADGEVPDFEVVVYNKASIRDPRMSSTVQVEFHYKGRVIHLKEGGETTVDDLAILFLETDDLKINVNFPSVVVDTNIGVTIRWDGRYMVEVDVTGEYFGHTEGLCGTYNGSPEDDYLTRFGETLSPDLEDPSPFGRTWFVPGDDGCVDCEDCVLPEACQDAEMKAKALEICNNIISDTGPFQECHAVISPSEYMKWCVMDTCAWPDGIVYCEDYHAYADKCKDAGIPINWRKQDFCFIDCGSRNMMYNSLSSACPATCANPLASATCNQADKEDCVCPFGMLKEGMTCVEEDKCGCVDSDGFYYKQGEGFMDKTCTKACFCCAAGDLQCHGTTCSSNEVCGTRNNAPACVCDTGYLRDTETNTCEAIPIPVVHVRPQFLMFSVIECKLGYVDILEANFGPQVDEICLEADDPASCNFGHSLAVLRNLCQGTHDCMLSNGREFSFGEPCYGVLNYLYVKYACTHKPITHTEEVQLLKVRTCQQRPLYLGCNADEELDIQSVFFGRRGNDAYCLDDGTDAPLESYSDDTALDTVQQYCSSNGQDGRYCALLQNLLPDLWPDSKEYLEVEYRCIPKITEQD